MISSDVSIAVQRNISDTLVRGLRNFIALLSDAIRRGSPLVDAIDIAASANPNSARAFVIASNPEETFGLDPTLLFSNENQVDSVAFMSRSSGKKIILNGLCGDDLRHIAASVRLLATTPRSDRFKKDCGSSALAEALCQAEIFKEVFAPTGWELKSRTPGIIRLQHASFLLQTLKARILVDPHFVSGYSLHLQPFSMMPPHLFTGIDAILITHSHSDHYHLPSLMALPPDIPVLVPRVPVENLLCPSFKRELETCGFSNVIEMDWYSAHKIEDLEIIALPFYGEQPLRDNHPRDVRLRNWGNSYYFRTPSFSGWCLIDSGTDGSGSMIEVARTVQSQFGGVDVILSNLQEFFVGVGRGNPFYITGGGHYWLTLTPAQVITFPQMADHLITLGARGVAEICRITNAGTFLPYSHLWSEIGTSPRHETKMLELLSAELRLQNVATQIVPWRIGSFWQ